jgi:hydroxymethylpyrimidine/phosphomethylpyrimidine kinase
MPLAAVKLGMLATHEIVAVVTEAIARLRPPHVVADPVLAAKGGFPLLEPAAVSAYVERLFPLASVLTPNLDEAEVLLGRPVRDVAAMREAAQALRARGPRVVVVKGGHLEGAAVDVFFDGTQLVELAAARIYTRHTRGTGCTFASAIAARLALGDAPLAAVQRAKQYLGEALRRAYPAGAGRGTLGRTRVSGRPERGEYADYAQADIDLVAGDDIVATLSAQLEDTTALLAGVDEGRASTFSYAPGKWTIKQVVGHLSDDERIFAYRLLCVARGDTRPLPGFEEKEYMATSGFEQRTLADLLGELRLVRAATLRLLSGLPAEAWLRFGSVNGYAATPRGLAFHIAGHELHHVRILREKYLA